jgi:hypothetical protein
MTHITDTLQTLNPEVLRLLLPIVTKQDYEIALQAVQDLWDKTNPVSESVLALLTERIETYEDQHYTISTAPTHCNPAPRNNPRKSRLPKTTTPVLCDPNRCLSSLTKNFAPEDKASSIR